MSTRNRLARLEKHIAPPPGRCRECASWPSVQLTIIGGNEEWSLMPPECPACGWQPRTFTRDYGDIPASVV